MSTNLIPVKQADDQFVNLLVVYNALNFSDRQLAKLTYEKGKTLETFMEGLPDPEMWSVCVNAEPYAPSEWASVYPQPNDYITVIPVPYGGGGGSKNILRVVAMIAVAVVAPMVAGAYYAVGTIGYAAVSAGVTIAGGLLINALLPPPKPSTNNRTDTAESPTYGLDGPKNTQTEDVVVPLIYGQYRYGGNYVNVKTENRGKTQIIYAQAVVSEGEIEAIDSFEIDGQPSRNFEEISVVTRMGTAGQSITGWFASTVSMQNRNVTLSPTWVEHTTTGEIDAFRIDLLFPNGLSNINEKNGDRQNRSVTIEMQYRLKGTSTWATAHPTVYREVSGTTLRTDATGLKVEYSQSFKGTTPRTITGKLYMKRQSDGAWILKQTKTHKLSMTTGYGHIEGTFSVSALEEVNEIEVPTWFFATRTVTREDPYTAYKIEWSGANPATIAYQRYKESPKITAKTGQPLRKSFESGPLQEGIYDIRIRRTNTEAKSDYAYDKVVLTDVAEIISERVAYKHTAYYGVRVRLTDQLNGLPKMTARVKGIKVPQYGRDGKLIKRAWSANPAWIVVDMLTNRRYGAGMPASRLDMPMFVEWAAFCDQKKYYFNGVIDTFSNIWDACQLVLRVGHARFTSIGNVISLSIYRASEPVMMFGTGNILEGSLRLSWQSMEDRSNEFEVEYFDRDNGNKQNTVRVADEESIARGDLQRISTIKMIGIDNQKQALHEAHFQKALNQVLVMSGSFEATVESLACSVGDVVLLQHDMPDWGESGRVQPGSTKTDVIVDRDLTTSILEGATHTLLILHPAIKRADATVSTVSATGNTIYVTAPSSAKKSKRVKFGDRDRRIVNIATSGAYLEIVLDSVSGISPGATVELWDTDVIESRDIFTFVASTRTVKLVAPLSIVPSDFSNYMVGVKNAEAKPVSIVGIDGDGEYKRTISFIEYNETVFNPEEVQETPLYTSEVKPVQHVQDLVAIEELSIRDGTIVSDILVSWNAPTDGNYAGANVYMAKNGGAMTQIGTAFAGATSFATTGKMGQSLTFKVVAYDGAGRTAKYEDAPVWMVDVMGMSAPPEQVKNFKVEKGLGGIEFTWSKSPEIDIAGYEIREGLTWESGIVIVENYAGNRFFTTKKKGGFYTYQIKAVDRLGNMSEQATSAFLTLPAPAQVYGFVSVQSADQLVLQWRKNPEVDVMGYEIRQGLSWGNSKHVASVQGTSLTVPAGASLTESFLIKAYDSAGVESHEVSRVNQQVARSQMYNAVYELDTVDVGFSGHKINLSIDGPRLQGGEATFFEYTQPITMPKRYNASVVTQEIVGIMPSTTLTWSDMNFPWMSPQATIRWFYTEESESLVLEKHIALYEGPRAGDIAGWTLESLAASPVYGAGTLSGSSVSNSAGRFGHGLAVTSASTLEATVASGNAASWWVKYQGTGNELGRLVGSSGTVTVKVEGGAVKLVGATTAAQTTAVQLKSGNHYFVAMAAVDNQVRAIVGHLETGSSTQVTLQQDIGALSKIKLA